MKNFEKVCVTMELAKPMERRCDLVFEILSNASAPMRVKDVAKIAFEKEPNAFIDNYLLGRFTNYDDWKKSVENAITSCMHWLMKLNLVERTIHYEEPKTIKYFDREWVITTDEEKPYVTKNKWRKFYKTYGDIFNARKRYNEHSELKEVEKEIIVTPHYPVFTIMH